MSDHSQGVKAVRTTYTVLITNESVVLDGQLVSAVSILLPESFNVLTPALQRQQPSDFTQKSTYKLGSA
jgi:hypothetical protein